MALISKLEPVITLDNFRYRGRSYKEGSYLDRRRCGMPQSKLNRMLREKKVIMARDLTPDQLKKYGWVYDPMSPRTKLQPFIDKVIDSNIIEEKEEPIVASEPKFHIHDRKDGWFDVMEGENFVKKRVRKKTAKKILKDLEGGGNE